MTLELLNPHSEKMGQNLYKNVCTVRDWP